MENFQNLLMLVCFGYRELENWVHLNLVEISIGHFGRTRCAPTIGVIIGL